MELAALAAPSASAAAAGPSLAKDSGRTTAAAAGCCAVVELRQYTLHPGQREALIELFEHELIEGQEAAGIQVLGQFRDLDDADRFVWLRGFDSLPARAEALRRFYTGPVWQAHRDAANATMIDSDNVLLLRPADALTGWSNRAAAPAEFRRPSGLVVATLYYFDAPVEAAFVDFFATRLTPVFGETGAAPVAAWVTEEAANDFPRLPVREGEHVFLWFARFDDVAACQRYRQALAASPRWRALSRQLRRKLMRDPQVLKLAPSARSRLR